MSSFGDSAVLAARMTSRAAPTISSWLSRMTVTPVQRPPAPARAWSRLARCIALLAGLRGGRLIARPSFFQLDNLRRARRHGQPWHLIVHEDVLIFRNPPFPGGSGELRGPQDEPKGALRPASVRP